MAAVVLRTHSRDAARTGRGEQHAIPSSNVNPTTRSPPITSWPRPSSAAQGERKRAGATKWKSLRGTFHCRVSLVRCLVLATLKTVILGLVPRTHPATNSDAHVFARQSRRKHSKNGERGKMGPRDKP